MGLAQEPPADGPRVDVEIAVQQELVTGTEQGEPVREIRDVGLVTPGDVLIYTLRARNTGSSPAFEARLQDPIPDGTVLLPETVATEGTRVTASLDGGESWKTFPVFIPGGEDDTGQPVYVPAPGSAYTHLRWELDGPLPPGAAREVTFKVQVR